MKHLNFCLIALLLSSSVAPSLAQSGASKAVPTQAAPQQQPKKSLLSLFRRKRAAPPQAAPQMAPAPKRGDLVVPGRSLTPAKRPGLRLPKFRKPDLSKIRIPKPNLRMPKVSMPKLSMPKIKMPSFRRSGGGATEANDRPVYAGAISTKEKDGYYAIVRADQAKFYELGPSQPFGPDAKLKAGTLVTLRSNDRSWATVKLKDGRQGYVALDQIRFAAVNETPKILKPTKKRSKRKRQALANSKKKKPTAPPAKDYVPPALPEASVVDSEPQFNPLLDPTADVGSGASVVPDIVPIDSPDVLFNPILDPIPSPSRSLPPRRGGPRPFLEDPLQDIYSEPEDDGSEASDDA